MPKEDIDMENIIPYKNSAAQILQAHKQVQKKVCDTGKKQNNEKLNKIRSELNNKNTYFTRSKLPEENETELINTELNLLKELRKDQNESDNFCQKCPKLRSKCAHKSQKENMKDKYSYPLTTSTGYGWLNPFDNLNCNYKMKSEIQQFYDKGHL